MNYIKFITNLLTVIFLLQSTAFAQNCTPLKSLTWPDELIHFYFKKPGIKVIPIPHSFCKRIIEVEIKNLSGMKVGTFNVKNSVQSLYNDASVRSKNKSKIMISYNKTIAKFTNPYLFTDFIFKLFNDSYLNNYKKEIQFLYGEMIGVSNSLNWSPLYFTQKHWHAKNINYNELIQFYDKPNVEFITFDDEDGYFFPKAIPYNQYVSKFIKDNLLDIIFNINLKAIPEDRTVVVFSTYKNSLRAYNLISKLFVENIKNVYWFNNANINWVHTKDKSIKEILKKVKIADTNEFITNLKNKSNIKILDISSSDEFELNKIKNSIPINPKRLFGIDYKEYYLKSNSLESYNKLSESHKNGGGFMFTGLDKIDKKSKVYIVGHHMLDPYRSNDIAKVMTRMGYTDVSIVLESISEIGELISKMKLNPEEFIITNRPSISTIGSFEVTD